MKTRDRQAELADDFEIMLRRGLDRLAADTQTSTPDAFDPDSLPITSLTPSDPRRWTPYLVTAAAAIAVVVGLITLQQNGATSDERTAATQPVTISPSAAFSFATPTVRLAAERIDVIAGDDVSAPTAAKVDSDPGNSEYTSLELSWTAGGREQRLYFSFVSDGTSWWADTIRTYDANDEWIDSPAGQRWFASPIGQVWSGDLDLPNVRITNMTIEAFLRPASCDNPTSPIAVVAAYPSIEGIAAEGLGFSGRIDLIDTATCTPIDATPYAFTAVVDDPTVAEVIEQDQLFGVTTTVGGGSSGPSEGTVLSQFFGRFGLAFRSPGETIVRVTVTDSAGTVIGTTTTPVIVRTPDDPMVGATVTTVMEPGVEVVPAGSVVCVVAGASDRAAALCADEFGGTVLLSNLVSQESFVMPVDPTYPDHVAATANAGDVLSVPVRMLDASWVPTSPTELGQTTYLVLGTDEGPYAT